MIDFFQRKLAELDRAVAFLANPRPVQSAPFDDSREVAGRLDDEWRQVRRFAVIYRAEAMVLVECIEAAAPRLGQPETLNHLMDQALAIVDRILPNVKEAHCCLTDEAGRHDLVFPPFNPATL